MVSGSQDDLEAGAGRAGLGEELIEAALGGGGRTDAVENVARYDQRVGSAFHELPEQPFEETTVFRVPVEAVELLAKVPVGRVDESKRHEVLRGECADSRRGSTASKYKDPFDGLMGGGSAGILFDGEAFELGQG